MPRRDDLNTILVLGSGPIKIGQAAEFDFSGSQAVRALREDGYEVILVNSNPATIQNDPEMADRVYIEPLLPDTVRKILEIEKPDALLAGMGVAKQRSTLQASYRTMGHLNDSVSN